MKKVLLSCVIAGCMLASCGDAPSSSIQNTQKAMSQENSLSNMPAPMSLPQAPQIESVVGDISGKIKDLPAVRNCSFMLQSCVASAVTQESQSRGDESLCAELSEKTAQEGCKLAVITGNAMKKKDEKVCDAIADQNQKNNCIAQVINNLAVEQKNISLCSKIPAPEAPKATGSGAPVLPAYGINLQDSCIYQAGMQLASMTGEEKYCAQMKEANIKQSCETQAKMTQKYRSAMPENTGSGQLTPPTQH